MANMDRAFAYARKSTEDTAKQVASIPDQLRELSKLTKQRNLSIVDTFTETKTGKVSGVRTEFYKMLERIEKGEVDTVICWKADRLARNGGDGGKVIELVDARKLKIVTPDNTYTRENSMFLWIEFMSSTKLSKDISDNVTRNNNNKFQGGIYPGKAHLGYMYDPSKPKGMKDHIPNPRNWNLLREWVDLMITGNYTVERSLEIMTAKGLVGNSGLPISRKKAFDFFRDIFYIGLFIYKGQVREGVHQKLMSLAEFNLIQRIIDGRIYSKNKDNPLPLQGLFKCGMCGYTVTGEKHKKGDYYRCSKKSKKIKCNEGYVNTTEMDKQTKDYVYDIELIPELIEWSKQTIKEQNILEYKRAAKDQELKTKRLAELTRRKFELREMKNEGLFPDEADYQVEVSKVVKAELDLKQEVYETNDSFWDALFEKLLNFSQRVKELYESDDPVVKRMIVEIIGSNFVVKDKKLKIKAKDAFVVLQKVKNEFYRKNLWLEPNTEAKNMPFRHESQTTIPFGTA